MNKLKEKFLEQIKNININPMDITCIETYNKFESIIYNMPICYTKGYIQRYFEQLPHENLEETKESLLELKKYSIWGTKETTECKKDV